MASQSRSQELSWCGWLWRMPPCHWVAQTNHRFMVGIILAHGFTFLGTLLSTVMNLDDIDAFAMIVLHIALIVTCVLGSLVAHFFVKNRPRCYEFWILLVWLTISSIFSYATLLMNGVLAKVRMIALNAVIWKVWPTMLCRSRISIPYLAVCLFNDCFSSGIAQNWESAEVEGTDQKFPTRAYTLLVCITIAYACIALLQNHRMHSFHNALVQLASEKNAFQSLMTMVSDATVWIAADSKVVLHCDKRFDMMMGKPMQGEHLSELVINPEKELARLLPVFTQDTRGGGCTQPPVVLLPTTLSTATGPATADLFIVRNQWEHEKDVDQPHANAILVGVRLNDLAGVPSAPPPNILCDVKAQHSALSQRGLRSIACSDEEMSAPFFSSCDGQSAPAVLVGAFNDQESSFTPTPNLCGPGGDCLPATAVAWIDKCPVPKPLHEVSVGERILCFDNVASKLTYADVLKVAPAGQRDKADWVKISLADGSLLSMTADHPVAIQRVQDKLLSARKCLSAGELQANSDKLLVLKITPTLVTNVEYISRVSSRVSSRRSQGNDKVAQSGWITVEVEQPERHELLVSSDDKRGMPGEMIVVSSCDRKPDPCARSSHDKNVKNTFFCIPEDDDTSSLRAHSAPPSVFRQRTVIDRTVIDRTVISISKTSDSTSGVSTLSDSLPSTNSLVGDPRILVGYSDTNMQGDEPVNRLSDLIHCKRSGYPSQGSAHMEGDCRPCSFHYTWQRMPDKRPPCKMSYQCEYCHDLTHTDGWKSRYRKRRPPTKRQLLKIAL